MSEKLSGEIKYVNGILAAMMQVMQRKPLARIH